ncbi:MAG: glucose-1-phosphate adenylyltransferase [Planctomycetota bacterium]
MREIVTFVLGGGRGTRLYPLTKHRSKPAVPLAGKYRLIDIPLSNCINSGLNRIYVLTQFMSVSLHRHIRRTYNFDHFSGGYVEILAAQKTLAAGTDWYEGTADAVRKNMRYFEHDEVEQVLILSGDQLYHMDYAELVRTHTETGADVTIAALPVARNQASELGIMRVNDDGQVTGFLEKPQTDEELDLVTTDPAWIDTRGIESRGRECLASMGIYLFNKDTLLDVLKKTTYEDFGKEIFPASIRTQHVQLHLFDGYWEDIGTIRSFYEANLALARPDAPFTIQRPETPIYSRARYLPPSRFDGCQVSQSMIADGCQIGAGSTIERSVIGLRCVIGENVTIRDSVIMGADWYETDEALQSCVERQVPPLGIGEGSEVIGAILDKNCRIGRKVSIHNRHQLQQAEVNEMCEIRDGIPVVVKDGVIDNGWRLQD